MVGQREEQGATLGGTTWPAAGTTVPAKGGEAVLGTDRLLVEVHPELCRPDQPFDWSPIWSSGQSRASRRL